MTKVSISTDGRSAWMLASRLNTTVEHLDILDGKDSKISMDSVQKHYAQSIVSHTIHTNRISLDGSVKTEESKFYFVDNGDGDVDLHDLIIHFSKGRAAPYKYSIFSDYFINNVLRPDDEEVPVIYEPDSVIGNHDYTGLKQLTGFLESETEKINPREQYINVPPANMQHIFGYMSRHIFNEDPGPCYKTTDAEGETVNGGCTMFGFSRYMQGTFPDRDSTFLICAEIDKVSALWYCYEDPPLSLNLELRLKNFRIRNRNNP